MALRAALALLMMAAAAGVAAAATPAHRWLGGGRGKEEGCTLGGQRWADLSTGNFTAATVLDGRRNGPNYVWAYRPCSPAGLCPNAGYIQQKGFDSACYAHWDTINSSRSSDTATTVSIDGTEGDVPTPALATVTIACDPQVGAALVDDNHGTINVVTVAPNVYLYQFNFRSGCACGKGCSAGPPTPTPSCFVGPDAWYNTRQVQFSARPVLDGEPQPPNPVMLAFAPCGGATLCPSSHSHSSHSSHGGVLQILLPPAGACSDLGHIDAAGRTDNGVQLNVTGDLLALHSDSNSSNSSNINRKNGNGNGSTEDLPLLAVINIQCDPSAVGGVEDRNQGFVHVHKGLLRQIATLNFASACACGSGCPPT